MVSSLLLRVSVVLLLIGMCLGIGMGIAQEFSLATAHAHLNLTGFVLPFIAGLYYRAVPQAGQGGLAMAQAALAIVGGIVFPIGIAAVTRIGHQFEPLVIGGSLIVLSATALFALIVFRTSAVASEDLAQARPQKA